MLGSDPAAASSPICEGDAPRRSTAVNGSATEVMAVPAPEVTWATQRRVKARLRQRDWEVFMGWPASISEQDV